MTISELKDDTRAYVTIADIAPIVGMSAAKLRAAAQHAPQLLGFSVTVVGQRVMVPRKAFISFTEGTAESA